MFIKGWARLSRFKYVIPSEQSFSSPNNVYFFTEMCDNESLDFPKSLRNPRPLYIAQP